MNEERMRILKMLEEGKISVDEAAKLIEALEESQSKEEGARKARWLRIRVAEKGKEIAKLNIPLSLFRFGMKFIPPHTRKQMVQKGINPEQVLREVESGEVGKLVEVEQGSDRVEIWLE
ncbi:MAG: hypothetical protein B1H40_01125 [Candidatus Latescibacteria bacterium 4484_181]|nr:MAG: hypothetical protein B1H40_01125 [Candidatus Latescibacteria bacterium 4484_181]RKY72631.1 MAG: hypothetical protein DRQ24_04590 [Candidatus Latescibacterota bacterium]